MRDGQAEKAPFCVCLVGRGPISEPEKRIDAAASDTAGIEASPAVILAHAPATDLTVSESRNGKEVEATNGTRTSAERLLSAVEAPEAEEGIFWDPPIRIGS